MGTSSMIGVYNKEDGSVTATYCHYDGYLSYNGRLLMQSYNTPVVYNSVETFLKCGDNHCGAEFLYLFDGEAWFFSDTYTKRKMRRFEEVEMNLEKEAALT